MSYSNNHLIEVNCGFQFRKETTPWDNTLFGQFYERIKGKGFKEKEQRKSVSFAFALRTNNQPIPSQEIEEQFIFRNDKGWAITLAPRKISFHITKDYTVWDDFRDKFITPFFEVYRGLDLGNGERDCSLVYLNRFTKHKGEDLSKYFNIISSIDKNLGTDRDIYVQRVIDNGANHLIAKLNSRLNNNILAINFECGAVNIDTISKNSSDWIAQANMTHAPVHDFFESIITADLRKELEKI